MKKVIIAFLLPIFVGCAVATLDDEQTNNYQSTALLQGGPDVVTTLGDAATDALIDSMISDAWIDAQHDK